MWVANCRGRAISPSNEEACNELQRALYSSTPLVVVLGFVGESSIPKLTGTALGLNVSSSSKMFERAGEPPLQLRTCVYRLLLGESSCV